MSHSEKQKEEEKFQLKAFIESVDWFPNGKPQQNERPDFLMAKEDGSILGIELTDIHRSELRRATDSERNEMIKQAEKLYVDSKAPAIQVTVHFRADCTLGKEDRRSIPKKIVSFIKSNLPPEDSEIHLNIEEHEDGLQKINAITIRRSETTKSSYFFTGSARFLPYIKKSDIEQALLDKEKNITEYRKACSELWLIISCEIDTGLSTHFKFPDNFFDENFSSSFDRVFLFQNMRREVHELKLTRKM